MRSRNKRKSVTLVIVHKGNIMRVYTGGRVPRLGLQGDRGTDFGDKAYPGLAERTQKKSTAGRGARFPKSKRPLPGVCCGIADQRQHQPEAIALQQVLTRPTDFDVIATPNLNGDYLSDALAAQVGGIGIAPGGNINYVSGHAIFEATHGTAPKYANKDMVNPGSVVLSGEMMFRYLGWTEVADMILKGLNGAIGSKRVTYDFARMMEAAKEIKCSEFGDNIIAHM